jgi:indole-3-glycerol phosphate synthase
MADFLIEMEASSRARLHQASELRPMAVVRSLAERVDIRTLRPIDFHIFAEVKPASPAEGLLDGGDLISLAAVYEAAGATALSVLTEPSRFGGSLGLQEAISGEVHVPVMRKDFLVDPYQIWEARAFGADGVLIIARMFDADTLMSMIQVADEAGLFVLLEVFDSSDIPLVEVAIDHRPGTLVGVNSRDLATLEVRQDAHEQLAELVPNGVVKIAESGITSVDRVVTLKGMGYDGVLVGTSLMRSPDPGEMISQMLVGVSR